MEATVKNITNKIVDSYYSYSSLSENEKINEFLDHINDKKKEYADISKRINKIIGWLTEITWLDHINENDEIFIKGIIAMGKEADIYFTRFYATQEKVYAPKGLFKKELKELKDVIEFHLEAVEDLENIVFNLRKDKEFNDLCKLVDET